MDNYFKSCPAKMSDGRLLTDYRTAVRREEYNKYINNIVRDDEYRIFLQKNSEKIMDNEWSHLKNTKSCWVNQCVHNYPTRVYPPWFVEERQNYDSLASKTKKFPCEKFNDYRMSITKDSQ